MQLLSTSLSSIDESAVREAFEGEVMKPTSTHSGKFAKSDGSALVRSASADRIFVHGKRITGSLKRTLPDFGFFHPRQVK